MSATNPWYSNPNTGLAGLNPVTGLTQVWAGQQPPTTMVNGVPSVQNPSTGEWEPASAQPQYGTGAIYKSAAGQTLTMNGQGQLTGTFQTPGEGGTADAQDATYVLGPNGTATPVSDVNYAPGSVAANLGRGAAYIGAGVLGGVSAAGALGAADEAGTLGAGADDASTLAAPSQYYGVGSSPASGMGTVPAAGVSGDTTAAAASGAAADASGSGGGSILKSGLGALKDIAGIGAAAGLIKSVVDPSKPSASTASSGSTAAATPQSASMQGFLGQPAEVYEYTPQVYAQGQLPTGGTSNPANASSIINFNDPSASMFGYGTKPIYYQVPGQSQTPATTTATPQPTTPVNTPVQGGVAGLATTVGRQVMPGRAQGGRVHYASGGLSGTDPSEFAQMDFDVDPSIPAAPTPAPVAGSDAVPQPTDAPMPYAGPGTPGAMGAADAPNMDGAGGPLSRSALQNVLYDSGLSDWWDRYTKAPGTTKDEHNQAQQQAQAGIIGLGALASLIHGSRTPPTAAQLAGTLKQNNTPTAAQLANMSNYFGTPAARYVPYAPQVVRVGGSGLDALAVKAGSATSPAFSSGTGAGGVAVVPGAGLSSLAPAAPAMASGGAVAPQAMAGQYANPYLKVSLPTPASAAQVASPAAHMQQQMQMAQFSQNPSAVASQSPGSAMSQEQLQQYLQSTTTPTGNFAQGGEVQRTPFSPQVRLPDSHPLAKWQDAAPPGAGEFQPTIQGPFVAPGMAGRDDKGQADTVPAMLSHGEYVMDADTVSNLGDGNNAAGAKALDGMRAALREHKRSAPPSQIPPKAKSPLEYLKGG